jgi:hypothetical protein
MLTTPWLGSTTPWAVMTCLRHWPPPCGELDLGATHPQRMVWCDTHSIFLICGLPTLHVYIFLRHIKTHKRLFYPPMLGLLVSSFPLLMSGPAPRLKTCLCGDAGEPTRTPALALPLSLSSPNLSPTHHQIHTRRGLPTRQLWPAHSLRRPPSSGRLHTSRFPVRVASLAFSCLLCHPRQAAVRISFLVAGSRQNSTANRWWRHRSCRICGSSGLRSSGRCTSPNPIRWHWRARGASFARVTSTPGVAPASLRLGLRVGELVLYSGMHRRRARDSSFPDLHPRGGGGGARAWGALPANPLQKPRAGPGPPPRAGEALPANP